MIKYGFGQSGPDSKIDFILAEQIKLTDFFSCWYKFTQIKGLLKIFGVGMVKNGCGQLGDET